MSLFPSSLTQAIEQKIIDLIVNGELKPAANITEAALAKRFAVSTSPVHQALQSLSRNGLVKILPRKGTIVFEFSPDEVVQMMKVRYVLECEAIAEAVEGNHSRLCVELGKNIHKNSSGPFKDRLARHIRLDKEFHSLFFTLADNGYLNSAHRSIEIKLRTLWNLTMVDKYTEENMLDSIEDHNILAELVRDRNVREACEFLRLHMGRLEKIYFSTRSA